MTANLSPLGARSHSGVCQHVSRPPAWSTQDAGDIVWQRACDPSEGRGMPLMVIEGSHCTSVLDATNLSHVVCGSSESSNHDQFEDRLTNPEPRAPGSPSNSRFLSFMVHLGALATGACRGASSALENAKCDHAPAQCRDTRSLGGTAIKESSGKVQDGVGVVGDDGGGGGRQRGGINWGCEPGWQERASNLLSAMEPMLWRCSSPGLCDHECTNSAED